MLPSKPSMPHDNSKLRVPFGLRDGRLYAPGDVENGLACGCICPGCKSQLVANHPTRGKRDYFSHHHKDNCLGGYETAVHLMAKQIIEDAGWVTLPEQRVEVHIPMPLGAPLSGTASYPCHQSKFTAVEQEVSEGALRPDLTATLRNGATLFIEIYVTHEVEERKAKALDNLMEIDLSHLPLETATDPEALSQAVLETAPRKWFRCSLYDELPKVQKLREWLIAEAPGVLAERKRAAREELERKWREAEERRRTQQREVARKQTRERFREQHRELINLLQASTSEEYQKQRFEECFDFPAAQAMREQAYGPTGLLLHDGEPPSFAGLSIKGGWIINADPGAWQAHIILNHVFALVPGAYVDINGCAKTIRGAFGTLGWMERLNTMILAEKQRRGSRWQFGLWFLTPEENRQVTSTYSVVYRYLQELASKHRILKQVTQNGRQHFQVLENSLVGIMQRRSPRPFVTASHPVSEADAPGGSWDAHNQKCVETLHALMARGLERAFLCSYCHMPIEAEPSARCPSCDKGFLKPLLLTPEFAREFPRVAGRMGRQHLWEG